MNKDRPAFPQEYLKCEPHMVGMTLRDYFAAKVLQVSCEDYSFYEAAKIAYQYADAMLKAREE